VRKNEEDGGLAGVYRAKHKILGSEWTMFYKNIRTSVLYSKNGGKFEKNANILRKKFNIFTCILEREQVYLVA